MAKSMFIYLRYKHKPVRNLTPFESKILYILLWTGWIKENNVPYNIEIHSEFLMLFSGMNQLFRVKGIIVCLEQSVLQLQLVIWLSLVLMVCLLLGVNFIRQFGASSFFTLNMQLRCLNHVLDLTESSPNSW